MNKSLTISQQKAKEFRSLAKNCATALLTDWVGADAAGEAIGRVSAALACARQSAKKPGEYDACTPESVGAVVAISALTGIMPGSGATALAYAIPRRPRRNDPPNLTYQLSHRGINALAKRSGLTMIAQPVGMNDQLEMLDDASVNIIHMDFDNPPQSWDELRGILMIVKNLDGTVLHRGWVAKSIIAKRRENSDAYTFAEKKLKEEPNGTWFLSPWHTFPVEMAQKTAMHYAVARGWCVIDDTDSTRALSHDIKDDATINAPRVVDNSQGGVAALENMIEEDSEVIDAEVTESSEQPEEEPEEEAKGDWSKAGERWFRTIQTETDHSTGKQIIDQMQADSNLPIDEFKKLAKMVEAWDK